MATTRLIPLHAHKGKTVAQSLSARTDYATNPEKTEKGELVTAYCCDPVTVDEEFLLQKRQYQYTTGRSNASDIIAYQIRQSFKPGEVTAEEANRLGHELAMRFTKGRSSFIVATHTDRAHIHNHIVFNSVSMDGARKFRNFWLSSIALQKVSDLVCLENGLSVINPRPYSEREKRTEYPKTSSLRDIVRQDIDAILDKKPKDFSAFLTMLAEAGYEVKAGKHLAVKGKTQLRFIRLSSLDDGYTEKDIRRKLADVTPVQPEKAFNLLIDIQQKMKEKGPGYARWATIYNLKQMSKTLLYLRDHKIENMDQLYALTAEKTSMRDELLSKIQSSEERLTEIAEMKKHVINYAKTRDVYEAYRKAGYSKKFFEVHREELMLHKAAKAAFETLKNVKSRKLKDLSAEYAEILAAKRSAYMEYKQIRADVQELLIAERNIASLYDAEKKESQRLKKDDKSH